MVVVIKINLYVLDGYLYIVEVVNIYIINWKIKKVADASPRCRPKLGV